MPPRSLALALALVLLASLAAGCRAQGAAPVKLTRVWAQPGDAPVFFWMWESDDRDRAWQKQPRRKVRAHVLMVDPATGRTTRLAETNADTEPFYWDARRAVLWVKNRNDYHVTGLTPSGTRLAATPYGNVFDAARHLPPPFAVRPWHGESTVIYNAQTEATWRVPRDEAAGVASIDGSRLRIGRVRTDGDRLEVRQTVIDWAGTASVRLPDIVWRSPPADPALGSRVGWTLASGAARLVELFVAPDGQRMVVHDVLGGEPARTVAIPLPMPKPYQPGVDLIEVGPDTFLVLDPVRSTCRRGYVAQLSQARLAPLPVEPCVVRVERLPGAAHAWIELSGERRFAYIDPAGALVDLGPGVREAIATGPATIAFSRAAGGKLAIYQLDLAAGTLVQLSDGAPGRLLHVHDGAPILLGDARIIMQRPGAPATSVPFSLPSRISRRGDAAR